MPDKVITAMSGGVDSSAAAYLLKTRGYDVIGVTMRVSEDESAVRDAGIVAKELNIPHYAFDLREQFRQAVSDSFVAQYLAGKTPNPCVWCNRHIKWALLMEKMTEFEADWVATGHYAEIVKAGERYSVKRAKNTAKDQTYALYRLTQRQLSKTIMPLYKFTKAEVRQIVKDAGLVIYDKPESQDICFVEEGGYKGFIESRTGKAGEKGEFSLKNGTVLGTHNGIGSYTVGQRKGLGISYGEPLFVIEIDAEKNRIVLGSNEELYKTDMTVSDINFVGLGGVGDFDCYCKIRYAHTAAKCSINVRDKIQCRFLEPQRAITPGQSAVFYDENGVVLAGGIIE